MKNTKIRTSSRAASSSSSLRLRICFGGGPPGVDVAVNLDQLELFDLDRLAVFEHLEVGLRQVGDRLGLLVGDDDVDADEVDAGAEHGLLRVALALSPAADLADAAALVSGCWAVLRLLRSVGWLQCGRLRRVGWFAVPAFGCGVPTWTSAKQTRNAAESRSLSMVRRLCRDLSTLVIRPRPQRTTRIIGR